MGTISWVDIGCVTHHVSEIVYQFEAGKIRKIVIPISMCFLLFSLGSILWNFYLKVKTENKLELLVYIRKLPWLTTKKHF